MEGIPRGPVLLNLRTAVRARVRLGRVTSEGDQPRAKTKSSRCRALSATLPTLGSLVRRPREEWTVAKGGFVGGGARGSWRKTVRVAGRFVHALRGAVLRFQAEGMREGIAWRVQKVEYEGEWVRWAVVASVKEEGGARS